MSLKSFYCGLVPQKGKRLGTQEECIRAKQVRHYGIEQVSASYDRDKKIEALRKEMKKARVKLTRSRALRDRSKEEMKELKKRRKENIPPIYTDKQFEKILEKEKKKYDKYKADAVKYSESIEALKLTLENFENE